MNKIRKILLVGLLLHMTILGKAQDSHTSNTSRPWYLPDHAVMQFAGNIGLLSAGPGYSYARDKMQTDILYGFTPGFEINTSIHILTAKTAYHPFKVELKNGYLLEPLRLGLGISYSVGHQFYTTWPEHYPDGYYWWTTSFRLTPFLGASISRQVGSGNAAIKRVQLYSELGSHDLAVVSFLNNKKLPVGRILNLALGTKLIF
ncbi:hypothetical protein AAE02nite_39730 [Adhaeribacter aerolatus]|uniref:Outer membrane protein beta-barrel domain-containing protein n=1 Tax=Adhaeribacter aerolatus TaxID=670289 RepID=A0A512B2X8_9BACT|nr:hypothetical protein [Adhaeribacter aerolatus]GEO06309.1 hypothetical protein AAE02nite_39730 [Adhaeribacter aerolatus]